ncbi:MAG: phospholipase D family protein [Rhizomicrobium sp.]
MLPGDRLLSAVRSARVEAVLIAPFIKADVIKRVLVEIAASVPVTVVTRWIPAEIAAGVSDLEVFDILGERGNAELLLNPLLHAKLYRLDEVYLFGSANLTGKALGWRAPANVELLCAAPTLDAELRAFEEWLIQSSMPANALYRDEIRDQVERLAELGFTARELAAAETDDLPPTWLPRCPAPERLWEVYSDPDAAQRRMVESAFEAAKEDLASLRLGRGLSEAQLYRTIVAALNQMPLIQSIDARASDGIGSTEAAALIEGAGPLAAPYTAVEMWEILLTWLQYFFPGRYRRESTGEMLRRGRVIG